jgi:hypothetical protein
MRVRRKMKPFKTQATNVDKLNIAAEELGQL